MATWVLSYTLQSYKEYATEATVTIPEKEQDYWQDIIDNMYFPEDQDLGIFRSARYLLRQRFDASH